MATTSRDQQWGAAFAPLGLVLAVLVGSNLVANLWLPHWVYVPWNIAVAAAVVAVAVRIDGRSARAIGLARDRVVPGLALGAAIAAIPAAVMVLGLLIPATRDVFMDERADVPLWEMLYKVFVEVPLGTVLLEEITFRGVLPAMVAVRLAPGPTRRLRANAVAAVLFGLWHILPSMSLGDSNEEIAKEVDPLLLQIGGTVLSVLVTAALAMGLSWMRDRSESVAAPAVLHTTTNSLGSALAWITQRVL